MWNVECGMWNVECGMWNVDSGMRIVECGQWNATVEHNRGAFFGFFEMKRSKQREASKPDNNRKRPQMAA
jgi:hypothetical protein